MMTKLMISLLGAAAIATGGYAAATGLDTDPARTVSLPGATDGTTATTTGATTTNEAGDISGPCDEAEHRNDPRCTGAGDDDDSGPGRGGDDDHDDDSGHGGDDDRDDDEDGDDRSGSNSGRG